MRSYDCILAKAVVTKAILGRATRITFISMNACGVVSDSATPADAPDRLLIMLVMKTPRSAVDGPVVFGRAPYVLSRQQRALRNHEHTRPRQKTACASVCTCPWPIAACTTRCTACTAPKPLDIILFSTVWRDEGAIFGEFTYYAPGSDQSRTKHACAADQRFRVSGTGASNIGPNLSSG